MEKQLNLFDTINEAQQPACFLGAVMRSAGIDVEKIIKTEKWQEFYENGKLWIDGEIAIINPEFKDLYDYRTGFKKYEGQPVARIGIWTKYFDNGQLAWQLNYGDGTYEGRKNKHAEKFTSFRKDGTPIISYW
jgi:antitoxin component YwqK of YwqJK toxin-antitoxin module